jgi:hypothetical protein
MAKFIRFILLIMAAGYYVGCNKVKFDKDISKDPYLVGLANCTLKNDRYFCTDNITASLGKVDILFVDDNSGSMSFEQQRMADKFTNFISVLDSKNVDYRIGIITTDVSSASNPARAINQNGALQDGKLIAFPDGSAYLSKSVGSSKDRQNWFAQTIKRTETTTCENFIRANPNVMSGSASYNDNCPSNDERGILAANMTISNNPSSFIRPEAHLSIVVLSDEDVRSSNYFKSNSFMISDNDLPQKLVSNVSTKFPGKTLSVHSFIVKPGPLQAVTLDQLNAVLLDLNHDPVGAGYSPTKYFANDSADASNPNSCLNQQGSQIPGAGFGGSYGYFYAVLTRMTGGVEGNICDADYGSQLGNMGSSIADQVRETQLRCAEISDLSVVMSPSNSITWTVSGSTLTFSDTIPAGTQVSVSYSCPSN